MGRVETLRKYGLTEDDYEWKLKEQDYKCAICRKSSSKLLVVDHDHASGRVRGLLCNHCNVRLGQCNDSPRMLAAMLVYLEDHGINFSTFDGEWEKECVKRPSLRTLIRPPPDCVSADADNDSQLNESVNDSIHHNVGSDSGIESTPD
jgi:hypothetical protein